MGGGRRGVLVGLVAAGCASEAPTYVASLQGAGIEVRGDVAVPEVVVRDGTQVVHRRAASASTTVFLPVHPAVGEVWTVSVGAQELSVAGPELPVTLVVAAPQGSPGRVVSPGADIAVVDWGRGVAELRVEAREAPVDLEVRWGGDDTRVRLDVVGAPWRTTGAIDGPIALTVNGVATRLNLSAQTVEPAELRDQLRIVAHAFPADPWGRSDATRPADTLTLPPRQWSSWMARWGGPVRDPRSPWAHQAVTLQNDRDQPLDVVVEATVEGPGATAFQPRLRDATSLQRVVASARLPPAERVTVALPLYVDPAELVGRAWQRRVRVTPLGADEPILEATRPLVLRQAAWTTWAGFVVAVVASVLGWGGMLWFGRRWLARQPTADLMTIGLFGALSYVVAGALQVVGHGVAAVLGPLAPLLTGLPDAALRACLLATLITLLPRPGVAALATVTGALLRGLTLGSFHPVDLMYVGSAAFWLELALWASGMTRGAAWRDGSTTARWLRTSVALGAANVGAVATGLCVAAALYRLYYAAWYVALLLVVPGFLYVVLGCRVAVDLAARLRRVAP